MYRAAAVTQRPLPDVMSFGYWMDKPRTEGLTGEQIQAGTTAHQWAPEIVRKENPNTGYRYLNLFPEKPRSLFIDCTERPQLDKDRSRMSCLSLTGWTGQGQKDINRRTDSGRRRRPPVRAGDCPERKHKHRIPIPKSFPGKAPELDSLTAQSGRSHTKTAPGCHVFRLLDGQAKN